MLLKLVQLTEMEMIFALKLLTGTMSLAVLVLNSVVYKTMHMVVLLETDWQLTKIMEDGIIL